MSTGGLSASLRVEGFDRVPLTLFRRAALRKAFRASGNLVAKAARKKLSLSEGSEGYPAQRTQRLKKSVRVRVSKSGLLVKVFHEKRADQKNFYAAYLHYGTSRGLQPRDNWMEDALAESQSDVRRLITSGALEALS